ncbi:MULTISPECIES: acyl-CoA-like ligand-binding transcription factor [Paenibacillus]|uniref:acyl-CoA-like ligand-binding transcription factor n=1 Tax=Paenibacillus TaxID=44249 RepID=UPI0022B8BC79|nr:TetR family transcriptional regulator [Paenibacillus caseinilyticus]MCZ8520360.1 TetR family transcriptional regulator [Paenibacillus caseinilyticus]
MAAVQRHALRLFREQGYNETTVEQIAEAAEISPSTFFRYFATKEDVVVNDQYDGILLQAFENQPPALSPLQALRKVIGSAIADMPAGELEAVRERNALVMSVPELRAAALNNLMLTMDAIAEMTARRAGRHLGDPAVRTFAGAVIGVNISVMLYYAENPEANMAGLFDEALSRLEGGLVL